MRFCFLIIIFFFYSFLISYYSFDLLEFTVLGLSKQFGFDLMLTQLEDLSLILFDFVNVFLLVFFIPVSVLQVFLFFTSALYIQEKTRVRFLLFLFLFGFYFYTSFFFFSIDFFFIYLKNSTSLLSFDLGLSTKVFVDLKKILFLILLLFKCLILLFLPLNFCLVFFINNHSLILSTVPLNFFFLFFIFLFDLVPLENSIQFLFLFILQLFQLELFILIKSTVYY